MRRLFCIFFACGLVRLWAGEKDFWVAKPYSEWSEKEVDKLLKNSPWSKPVTLSSIAIEPRSGSDPERRSGGRSFRGATEPGGPETGGGAGRGPGEGRGGFGDVSAPVTVYISWYARPIREALARRIQLHTPDAPQDQLDRLLNYNDPDHFAFLLMGWTQRMQGERSAQALQKLRDETCLLKKNKEKIPLADYVLPAAPGQPFILRFPREVDGKPAVTIEDKEVELVTRAGSSTVRARFRLADLVVNGQPEL